MNRGNTGQRFTKPKTVNVKLHGGDILVELECGHGYSYTPQIDKEQAFFFAKQRIGQRARCRECKVRSSGGEG